MLPSAPSIGSGTSSTLSEQLAEVCGTDPSWFCQQVTSWTNNDAVTRIAAAVDLFSVLLIIIAAVIANRLLRRLIRRAVRRIAGQPDRPRFWQRRTAAAREAGREHVLQGVRQQQRVEALSTVLQSAGSAVIVTVGAFLVLDEFGVNLAPLLAGAGVLGIALGFGAQALVRDFLAGIFIITEDQFGVSDIITIDREVSGTVEAMSLRTTRLRAVDGTVWHIPNGEIRRVGNQSQHWSRALLDIEVAYDTPLNQAEAVIKRVADELAAVEDDILDEPTVWGVEALAANGVVIRLVLKTTPSEQWRISRELRRRIKDAFDAEGIEIPLPQRTTWVRYEDGGPPGVAEPVGAPGPDGVRQD